MATLAFAAVGAAVGGALLPAGVTLLGATLTGAAIGAQVGAFAGSYVDQILMGALGGGQTSRGPRLSDLHVTTSTEGAPLARVYGRARLGGQIIWADEIEEEAFKVSTGGGGKGLGGGGAKQIGYRYFASFAVAVAEGEVTRIGRIWADGKELDLANADIRFHSGSETQLPDELLVASLGEDLAPAFRGVAYVVFDRLPLADYGNRLPQLSFEVFREVDDFNRQLRGVVMIPGSGEFVYATDIVSSGRFGGDNEALNAHTSLGASDWTASLSELGQSLPEVVSTSLVVSWFGSDLRAGQCELRPGVDAAFKVTNPVQWEVAGVERAAAYVVSGDDGRKNYGGTPSDDSVIAAIKDLRDKGFEPILNPFVLMDVPADNDLPDPYRPGDVQPAHPWRGRITCDPAPGVAGSVDGTATAAAQIASFVGSAAVGDFSIVGEKVGYDGPDEWSLRRMVLHYAHLAVAAGGVTAFVIGSEMRGLSTVRGAGGTYPFVTALVALANDVKSVLGPATKVTYAADWSEYFGHQPADGSGDVAFHLDPLWSSSAIDAVGIDLYWPLADWRDGSSHADLLGGARSVYDLDYLTGNVAGGEGYDWYYASSEDRSAQLRSTIADGAYGKPWIFRYKDLKSWWSQSHYDRPGGVEAALPTAWVPESKPVWFMEIGCPAVDKGANQPNVFVDPKSSETSLPHFSRGTRDDLMQRRYIEALISAFDPQSDRYLAGINPISSVYGERMVDLARIHVYAWDARPYPAFPYDIDTWSDGENWYLGHWLNGRTASASLSAVTAKLMHDFEFSEFDAEHLDGIVPGYVVDRVMSARDAMQPLGLAFFFDAIESGGNIRFRHRGGDAPAASVDLDGLVETSRDDALLSIVRGQETELPSSTKIAYVGATDDYRQQIAESRRLVGVSARVSQAELPIVLDSEQAGRIADVWLHETWSSRERAQFALPPTLFRIEPGDTIELMLGEGSRLVRVTEVGERGYRTIEARSTDPTIYETVAGQTRPTKSAGPDVLAGTALLHFLDLPLLRSDQSAEAGFVVARQTPWPGALAVYRSPEDTGFELSVLISLPATLGELVTPLSPGPEGRMDHASRPVVVLAGNALSSVSRTQLLDGSNAGAVRCSNGLWEVIQFERAELIAPQTYELSGLLRAQGGTEDAMFEGAEAGSPFVLLDTSLTAVPLTSDQIGLPYTWRFGPSQRSIDDATYGQSVHAFSGRGLKPLSPVHVTGRRDVPTAGDVSIAWHRRGRIGADSWTVVEIPLDEPFEAYEVDIFDGGTLKRTIVANGPSAVYSLGDQIADFGAARDTYEVVVYQLSAAMGRGTGRSAII